MNFVWEIIFETCSDARTRILVSRTVKIGVKNPGSLLCLSHVNLVHRVFKKWKDIGPPKRFNSWSSRRVRNDETQIMSFG